MALSTRLFLALSIAPLLVAQTQTKFGTDLLGMNPLGFWPLNPGFTDASTHGNNGIAAGGQVPFLSPGAPLGTATSSCCLAAEFDQGSFVPIPGPSFNLGALHPLTALAWTRTVVQHNFSLIVGKVDPAINTGWALGVDNGDVGAPLGAGRLALVFVVAGNPIMAVESTVAVNDGAEHLVAATYDGGGAASGVRLYVDGVAVATTTLVDKIGSSSIFNAAPLTIGALTDGSSSFEGDVSEVAVFGTVLTPAQNLQLYEDAGFALRVLPQFAFGGGWYSALYFYNTGVNAVSFPVTFTGDSGTPLNVPSIGNSSTTITFPPGGSSVIVAPNAGSLVQGYASITLPIGVNGYGVFRQSVPGIADQEGTANLAPGASQYSSMLYDETNNLTTAVAIVNPSSIATTVAVTVSDINGAVVGTSSVPLQPFSKTETTLRSLPGLSAMVGKQGTAVFTVSAGSVSVLGFRFNGSAFTSVPASGKAGI